MPPSRTPTDSHATSPTTDRGRVDPTPSGVLLVEFLPDCSCVDLPGAQTYPLLQAALKEHGIPVRWVYSRWVAEGEGGGPVPEAFETSVLDALETEARTLRASLAVLNHECSPSFMERLGVRLPNTRVVLSKGHENAEEVARVALENRHPTPDLGPPGSLWVAFVPDHASSNLLGARIDRFPFERLGARQWLDPCPHRMRIDRNPFYAGADLSGMRQDVGCSFCQDIGRDERPPEWRKTKAAKLDQFEAEFRVFLATAPPERHAGPYSLADHEWFPEALERVLGLPLPPSMFHTVRRADEVLRAKDTLGRLIPLLADRGHRVVFDCMGVENFSPRENDRLNKRLSRDDVEATLLLLHELETAWPETVWFFRRWDDSEGSDTNAAGFMMIMFTPWTDMEDLVINRRAIEDLAKRIEPVRRASGQLTSRLRLYPDTAIARAVARDGLAAREFASPVKAMLVGRDMTGGQSEIPWQFAHPEVAQVHRILFGIEHHLAHKGLGGKNPSGLPRPLLEPLARLLATDGITFLRIFGEVIEIVRSAPAIRSDEEVLRDLDIRLRVRARA